MGAHRHHTRIKINKKYDSVNVAAKLCLLPDYVVASPTINTFKARLNKFWENQDVRYNWKADISFTGSRSKVELTID